MIKPAVLTVSEVSGLLKIQRAKVYVLIESGCLKAVKIGADWRIRTSSVEKLIGEFTPGCYHDAVLRNHGAKRQNANQAGAALR